MSGITDEQRHLLRELAAAQVADPAHDPEDCKYCEQGAMDACQWFTYLYGIEAPFHTNAEALAWLEQQDLAKLQREAEEQEHGNEEWGEPHWGGDAVYAAGANDENPYPISDVDAEESPF